MAADEADYDELRRRPDVFMRGALEHTCAFVSEHDAQIAKRLARILATAPLARPPSVGPENHHRDYFVVDLDVGEVQTVLEALGAQRSKIEESDRKPYDGGFVLLQALVEDWLELATFLIKETAAPGLGRGHGPPPIPVEVHKGPGHSPDFDLN